MNEFKKRRIGMLSEISIAAIGMALCLATSGGQAFAASGKSSSAVKSSTEIENEVENEVENETEVKQDKAAKDAQKIADKAAKDAAKTAKKATQAQGKAVKDAQKAAQSSSIQLLAKMKVAETSEVDVSENEASLKYRLKNGVHKLTAEIEGFNDGDIFNMYVLIGEQEILVSKTELISDGTIARQEIEFDDATWPTGLPLELSAGMKVLVRSAAGALTLEGSLAAK
jgi:hypothetical protein